MKSVYILFSINHDQNEPKRKFEQLFWKTPSLSEINEFLKFDLTQEEYNHIFGGQGANVNGVYFWLEEFKEPRQESNIELKDKTGRKSFFQIICNGITIGAMKKDAMNQYILYSELPNHKETSIVKTKEECLSLMEQYLNEFIDKVTKK